MFTKLDPQPEKLAANEVALDVDGTLVAVSVKTTWLENNMGVVFEGVARNIKPDGTSCVCGNGQEVKTMLPHVADLGSVQALGHEVIAKEVMLALLGESLTTEVVGEETVPIIRWDAAMLHSTNIKLAAQLAAATGPSAIDPSNVLGL